MTLTRAQAGRCWVTVPSGGPPSPREGGGGEGVTGSAEGKGGGRVCITGPRRGVGGGVLFCVPCPCERSEFVTPPAAAAARERLPASSSQHQAGRGPLHPPRGAGLGTAAAGEGLPERLRASAPTLGRAARAAGPLPRAAPAAAVSPAHVGGGPEPGGLCGAVVVPRREGALGRHLSPEEPSPCPGSPFRNGGGKMLPLSIGSP